RAVRRVQQGAVHARLVRQVQVHVHAAGVGGHRQAVVVTVVEQLVGGELDPFGHVLLGAHPLVLLDQAVDRLEQPQGGELRGVEAVHVVDVRAGASAHRGDDARGVALPVGGHLGDLDGDVGVLGGERLDHLGLDVGVGGPDAPQPHQVQAAVGSGGAVRAAGDRAAGDGDGGTGAQGLDQSASIDHL